MVALHKTIFKKYDDVDENTRKILNKPLVDDSGFDPKDEEFLNLVVRLVDDRRINLYSPHSLINEAVYNGLTEKQQGKVDFDGVNLLATLRNIYNLWQIEKQPTFQIQNMVEQVRATKERLEEISGDVYIV